MIFQQTCETSTHLNAVGYLNQPPLKNPTNMRPKEKTSINSLTSSTPPFYKETSSPDASLPIASCCGCRHKSRGGIHTVVVSTVSWWEVFWWSITTLPPKKDTTHFWSQGKNCTFITNPIQICIILWMHFQYWCDVFKCSHLSCPVIFKDFGWAPKGCPSCSITGRWKPSPTNPWNHKIRNSSSKSNCQVVVAGTPLEILTCIICSRRDFSSAEQLQLKNPSNSSWLPLDRLKWNKKPTGLLRPETPGDRKRRDNKITT